MCITDWPMPEVEPHQYRLGSPLASIAGLSEAMLRRDDLDEDLLTHLRAIRELALDALENVERNDSPPAEAAPKPTPS